MKRFTLLELLIVVAIIGILVSILLPSLRKARQASERAVCMSNLKQIGVAMQLYFKNNKYYFPPMMTGAHRFGWLGNAGTSSLYEKPKPTQRRLNYYLTDSVTDDMKMGVVKCYGDSSKSDLFTLDGSSYSANTCSGGQGIRKTLNLGTNKYRSSYNLFKDVKSPDRMITMGEQGGFKSAMGKEIGPKILWHSDSLQFNMLTADGAVKYLLIPASSHDTKDYTFRRDR
jgi:prepilin-type N-terminal cleavage/methylation domain-containing protein